MSDMKHLLDIVEEFSEEEGLVEAQDSFDIELGEDLLIETGVIDINEDGILVEGDEETLRLLAEHGLILEETDWSKYDEPTVSRIAKGVTKPVDRTDYNVPPAMRDPDQGKPGYEKRRSRIMKGLEKVDEKMMDDATMLGEVGDTPAGRAALAQVAARSMKNQGQAQFQQGAKIGQFKGADPARHGSERDAEQYKKAIAKGEKATMAGARALDRLAHGGYKAKDGADRVYDRSMDMDPNVREEEVEESGLQAYLGNKKYGKAGMDALRKAGREGASKEKMAQIRAKYDKLDEVWDDEAGYDTDDPKHPDYAERKAERAEHERDQKRERGIDEAKYQGREVPLGKPMAGDVKKSKVYVRGPKGNVVKVNFGDKKMKIKKSNPKRRKSFRARHNCKNPGPRWKARYWSCRAW